MSSAVIEKLRAWSCDVDSALERFVDDEELYESCLEIFAEDSNFLALDQALATQDFTAAFEAAHALKGVASNLSLGALQDSIITVSDELKRGENEMALQHYPEMLKQKDTFLKLIKG